MKKIFVLVLLCALLCPFAIGCSVNNDGSSDKFKIMCTFFPQYDWVKNIIKDCDDVELSLLVENGVDIHSYQPTVQDCADIASSDMFIYIGGESETWVEEVIETTVGEKTVLVDLLEVLGDKALHIPESESYENGNHDDGHDEDCEYDEHIWLSLINAKLICNYIKDALCEAHSSNAEKYTENTEAYIKEIDALDKEYRNAAESADDKTVLFADRFPFVYMLNDYGIEYYAAFAGCSAETEASFETVAKLASKIDEHKLKSVIVLEGSDKKLADTVISTSNNKNCSITVMNSLQSVTKKQADNGVSYLGIMKENLEALKSALNISSETETQ